MFGGLAGLGAAGLAWQSGPPPVEVHTRGFVVKVRSAGRSAEIRCDSSPSARDIARRILWWAERDPHRPFEKLVSYAVVEHEAAVFAQKRRRFKRIFTGR